MADARLQSNEPRLPLTQLRLKTDHEILRVPLHLNPQLVKGYKHRKKTKQQNPKGKFHVGTLLYPVAHVGTCSDDSKKLKRNPDVFDIDWRPVLSFLLFLLHLFHKSEFI